MGSSPSVSKPSTLTRSWERMTYLCFWVKRRKPRHLGQISDMSVFGGIHSTLPITLPQIPSESPSHPCSPILSPIHPRLLDDLTTSLTAPPKLMFAPKSCPTDLKDRLKACYT